MNKQQLASTIWQSANQMRSKIEANEYKDYILGFMFYKYLSESSICTCSRCGDIYRRIAWNNRGKNRRFGDAALGLKMGQRNVMRQQSRR